MKIIQKIGILIFTLILLLPVALMNFAPGQISSVDNKALGELPTKEVPMEYRPEMLRTYVQDRIGFRNSMLKVYGNANLDLFRVLVHPSYDLGRGGHMFTEIERTQQDDTYIHHFALAVKKMQDYCESRDIPFVFMFDSSKNIVYSEYLPKGVELSTHNRDLLFQYLGELDVNYVDTSKVLTEKKKEGPVYNKEYDVLHWNDMGAFYGINETLKVLHEDFPSVFPNELEDYKLSEEGQSQLINSEIGIDETVPILELKRYEQLTGYEDMDEELYMDDNYSGFSYTENPDKDVDLLIFQGSYLNSRLDFFPNQFRDTVTVHNYENVLNMPYYYNIFRPDCVVFEVTDFTIKNDYFRFDSLKELNFAPPFDSFKDYEVKEAKQRRSQLQTEAGYSITNFLLPESGIEGDYVYLQVGDRILEMQHFSELDTYIAGIKTEELKDDNPILHFVDVDRETIYVLR